jgi:hypothetical protein
MQLQEVLEIMIHLVLLRLTVAACGDATFFGAPPDFQHPHDVVQTDPRPEIQSIFRSAQPRYTGRVGFVLPTGALILISAIQAQAA